MTSNLYPMLLLFVFLCLLVCFLFFVVVNITVDILVYKY